MVQQVRLPFNYEASTTGGATALAGIPLYLELSRVLKLRASFEQHLPAGEASQGWSAADVCLTVVVINLAGGDCVQDVDLLQHDEGFVRIAIAVACAGLPRRERRAKERLLAKTEMPVPSPSTIFRFLNSFHGTEQEVERVPGTAVIVPEHKRLRGLWQVCAGMLTFMQQHRPREMVTLDADATLVPTHKANALYCYKDFKAYQPLNFYVAEWGMVAYSEFRDGNVPCGKDQLTALKRALELLPDGLKTVQLRMDTQGYEWELLRYLAEGKNERFGVIPFAVGADMTQELKLEIAKLKASDWHELARKPGEVAQQWAEVPFVPNASATKKDGPSYRFVATREVLAQQPLPGVALDLPFPTLDFGGLGQCKLHAIVTNRKLAAPELITWYRQRCGKSEEAHSVMKSDLAGGKLPCAAFGANAAWWTLMLMALNLNELLKRLAMPADWIPRRMKAIRAHVICVAARVIEHARQAIVRLSDAHKSTAFIKEIRERILALEPAATG